MTKHQIMIQLGKILRHRDRPIPLPTPEDWAILERHFECLFPETFVNFIELISEYNVPLDIYSAKHISSDEMQHFHVVSIIEAYNQEISMNQPDYEWNSDMIPFADAGNGDVFCICRKESMAVFGIEHEHRLPEKLAGTFDEWLITWEF